MSLFLAHSAGARFGRVVRERQAGDFLLRLSNYSDSLHTPTHHHPLAYFSHVVRGAIREHCRGAERPYEAGSLHFHRPGEPHQVSFGPGGVTCLSIIPSGEIASWIASETPGREPVPSHRLGRLASRCYLAFRDDGDDASALSLEAAALELAAAWLREGTPVRARRPDWVDHVREHLRAHFAERVRLATLARITGVHAVHLIRAFRRHVGATPGAYLRELRIEAVRAALIESSRPIAEIALEAGFSSQAHLTRVFRRAIGVAPAAYRQIHRRGRR
jgi:AraC-like DNA-binding protein